MNPAKWFESARNAALRERNAALEKRVEELKAMVRNVRKGVEDVSPESHNSEAGMDGFFAEVVDEEPYRRFGRSLISALRKHDVVFDHKHVADAGTGPGIALHEMLIGSQPASVTGFDFSENALVYARKLMAYGKFQKHSIYDPLPNEFDIVICTEVLEHLDHPAQALQNTFRAVSPGGQLILSVPDGRIDFSRYHINFWSPESWKNFIEDNLPNISVVFERFRIHETSNYENCLAIISKPN
ncbi:class I SAM-dependent methyltransferase [Roseibacterium sp. SDUM158017]|nr:class I SAM-dependent methyltransferase [Roseibacterium sp. SDUM158017]